MTSDTLAHLRLYQRLGLAAKPLRPSQRSHQSGGPSPPLEDFDVHDLILNLAQFLWSPDNLSTKGGRESVIRRQWPRQVRGASQRTGGRACQENL